ncbi:MAG: class I SAM-dependent methyltransferase [Candidatus Eisenbacteria bacterium]
MPRSKVYDASYFERWYRKSDVGVGRSEFVGRKVRLAVAAAEYLLGYKIKSVLDVGCGEGPWRAHLKKLRPGVRYAGMDSSEYAVKRFGRARNIVLGSVGELAHAGFKLKHDLLVCADVLHYVPTPEVRAGLKAMHALCRGVAFIEAFTSADKIDGDRAAFQKRTAAQYRALFAEAGFTPVGLHLYATRDVARTLVALERSE